MRIYDCFTFNGEFDLLELRLNILDWVDKFVIVESPTTFAGNPKPLYYEENKKRFEKWSDKIDYRVVTFGEDQDLLKEAIESPLTGRIEPFIRSYYQKESVRKFMEGATYILYGDVDEIPKIENIRAIKKPTKLRQHMYAYYLNQRSSERWTGTFVAKPKDVIAQGVNQLRAHPEDFMDNGGWHFTNMGGLEAVKNKLESYDHQEFNNDHVKSQLEERMKRNEDFLGRGFKMWVDETDWPAYLKENRDRYSHLCRGI